MSVSEAPFRRLLRWYPRAWRVSNGEVFVATLVEAAEHDGRTTPTSADIWGAVVHGTGARLTARLALVLSIAALSFSVFAGVISVWALGVLAGSGAAFVSPLLTIGVVPLLTAVAAVAVIRDRGLIGDGRALVVVTLAAPALVLAGLAAWSWAVGFDAADAGTPAPFLATAWLPLIGAAMVTGVASLCLFIDSFVSRTQLSRVVCLSLSVVVSTVLTPLVGLALLTPYIGAGIALLTAVVAATPRRTPLPATTTPRIQSAPAATTRSAVTMIRALALLTIVGGVLGVTYALTGAYWSPGAEDGTSAMAQGITLLLVATIPLLAAFGVWADGHGTHRPLHVWGPLTLLAGALALLAAAYTRAPNSDDMAPWFLAGSMLAGGAISWWITPRIRLPRVAAITIGVFAGLLYAAFLGMMLTPLLAFTVPLLGILLLITARTPKPIENSSFPAKAPATSEGPLPA